MDKVYTDHEGNKFDSVDAMCDYHGVSKDTYKYRRRRGYSIKDSLSINLETTDKVYTDHRVRTFESVDAMCDYHGVSRNLRVKT